MTMEQFKNRMHLLSTKNGDFPASHVRLQGETQQNLGVFFQKKSLLDIDGPGPGPAAWAGAGGGMTFQTRWDPLKVDPKIIWIVLWWIKSFTLPKTNSSHLKIDLLKRRFLLEITIFQGATLVSGRVMVLYDHSQTHRIHRTMVYLTTLSCLIFMGISCRESHIITSWWSFTNSFETNAQVKLGSFP